VKLLAITLSLCLLGAVAQAEPGAQLTEWARASPPAHEGDAQPAGPMPAIAPAPPMPEVVGKEPNKDEKQTIVATTTPDQLATLSGLSVNASFDTLLGVGTFYNSALYSYLASSFFLSARYQFSLFDTKLSLTGTGYVIYEYTLPDAVNGRRWNWRDLAFSLSAPAIIKEKLSGISITPTLSATVPITLESWAATTITVVGAGLNFTRSIGRFDLAGAVTGSHGFYRSVVHQVPAYSDNNSVPTVVCRNGDPAACGDQTTNTDWAAGFSLTADLRATEKLSFSAQYVLRIGWKYQIASPGDPYNPQALATDGSPVACTGYCRGDDKVITSLGVNYQISDHWGLQFYTYTAMPPVYGGKTLRFPFWDFQTGPANYSQFGTSLSASF
jgi:hypothetical protein